MPDTNIDYRVEGTVAHVVINRPEKLNGLNLAMLHGLSDAAGRASKDTSLRAILLYGAGDTFSTGLDFADAMSSPLRVATTFLPRPFSAVNGFQDPAWAWHRVPVPVIAVIHGRCYGAGLQIALGADFRICHPDTEFSVLEAKWGLIPDMTASVRLAQLTSIDVAKRLTMTGEIFTTAQARDLGLITEVADDPHGAAAHLIEQISARSPDSVAAAKLLYERNWHRRPRRAFAVERRLQLGLLRGKNSAIARKAGLAHTDPIFTSRAR